MTQPAKLIPQGAAFGAAAQERNWLVWKSVGRLQLDGTTKIAKVPWCPSKNRPVDAKIAASYTLVEAVQNGAGLNAGSGAPLFGIGYLCRPGSAMVAVDMDDCVVDGVCDQWARDILGPEPAYTEFSPSGTGLRVLMPRQDGDDWFQELKNPEGTRGLGWFGSDSRFVTITMRHASKMLDVVDAPGIRERVQETLVAWGATPRKKAATSRNSDLGGGFTAHWITELDADTGPKVLKDILIHLKSKNYDCWLKLMFSARAIDRDWVWPVWDEWCRTQPSYDEGQNESLWNSADPDGDIGVGTLTYEAGQAGWNELAAHQAVFGGANDDEEADPSHSPTGSQVKPDVDYSHDSYALWFAKAHSDRFKYDATREVWREWDGSVWGSDTHLAVRAVMSAKVRGDRQSLSGSNMKAVRSRLGLSSFPLGALKAAEPLPGVVTAADDYDKNPWVLGVPDGYVDLKTGELCPPDPGLMLSKRTSVVPAEGTPVRWLKFLDEACGGDKDYVGYLQRLCGLFLTGDVREEKFWFMHGFGANGKGVFLRTVRRILNDYAVEAPSSTFMVQKNQEHLAEVARLNGARLVLASEVPDNATWNTQRLKEMTGDELQITARFMNQNHFSFEFIGKILIVGNAKPKLPNVDEAITRRLRLLPFTNTPKKKDPRLKENLEAEYRQILQWMLGGLKKYRVGGLNAPQVVTDASEEYLSDEDKFLQFWSATYEEDTTAVMKVADVTSEYVAWCVQNFAQPLASTSRGMGPLLTSKGKYTMKRSEGKVVVGWCRLGKGPCAP